MLHLPRGKRKVASKKRSRTIFIPRHTFFFERGYSSVFWLQDASASEQLHCGCKHTRHSRLDNFSLQNTTEVTFTFNPSYLIHCWYEVHTAQLHLVSVSALKYKQDKDSRSTVQSTSGKGKDRANPSWFHLIKEQRTHHTQALSGLYKKKLKTGKSSSIPKLMPKKEHITLRKTRSGWFQPFGDSIPLRKHKMVTRLQVHHALASTLLNVLDLNLAGWF